jgi:hypothetical protein
MPNTNCSVVKLLLDAGIHRVIQTQSQIQNCGIAARDAKQTRIDDRNIFWLNACILQLLSHLQDLAPLRAGNWL